MPLFNVEITGTVVVDAENKADASWKALEPSQWLNGDVSNVDIRGDITALDDDGEEVE